MQLYRCVCFRVSKFINSERCGLDNINRHRSYDNLLTLTE